MDNEKPRRMKSTAAERATGRLARWISGFLGSKPLSSPRRIPEWQAWAARRLADGWEHDAIERHIRDAWALRGNRDISGPTLPPELRNTLREVYDMAEAGATPAACAVVYRSLARQYPEYPWLADWASRWERAESDWRAVETPDAAVV